MLRSQLPMRIFPSANVDTSGDGRWKRSWSDTAIEFDILDAYDSRSRCL